MEQTLHEFVLNLLNDPQALAAFATDPEGALGGAGLSDISAADVQEVIPLVADYAPMQAPAAMAAPTALPLGSLPDGPAGAIAQLQQVAQALGGQFAMPQVSSADGLAMAESYTGALGNAALSASGTPEGHFAGAGTLAAAQGEATAAGSVVGSATDGVSAGSKLVSPLGDGTFSTTGNSAGDFAAGTTTDGAQGHSAASAAAGLADGVSGSATASNALGDFGFSGAATPDGHFAGNGSVSPLLGGDVTTGVSGSPADGLSIGGSFGNPDAGASTFGLTTPGLDSDLPMPLDGGNTPLSTQSLSQGSDTLASALANPAASGLGNPVDALSALAGHAPALPTPALPGGLAGSVPGDLAGNVPGVLPAAGAASAPQSAPQHPVSHAVDQVTQHVSGAGLPDVTSQLPTDAVQQAASHAIDQVTQHVSGAGLPDVTSQLPAGDPTDALQSGMDQAQQEVQHVASHSPLGGVSDLPGLDNVTHVLEPHALEDVHHVDGGVLDLPF